MKNVELKGIITPILTPMNADESVNLEELRNQIERLIDGGVHGIFPFGTNGEGYILNEKEKEAVLEAAIDQVKGTCAGICWLRMHLYRRYHPYECKSTGIGR